MNLAPSADEARVREALEGDLSALPEAELDSMRLGDISFEVRIVPMTLADGRTAHQISVWMRINGIELDISQRFPPDSISEF